MKGLKITKRESESVNRRMTGNAMTKRKRTNTDLQNTTQKTKDRATGGELRCSGKGWQYMIVALPTFYTLQKRKERWPW